MLDAHAFMMILYCFLYCRYFFGLFSLPLMEWSFTINNNSTYINSKPVVWILSEAAMELQNLRKRCIHEQQPVLYMAQSE